jgi:hypothetical protein
MYIMQRLAIATQNFAFLLFTFYFFLIAPNGIM